RRTPRGSSFPSSRARTSPRRARKGSASHGRAPRPPARPSRARIVGPCRGGARVPARDRSSSGWQATEEVPQRRRIAPNVRHPPTVEALTEEIGRIVAERQQLRAAGAAPELLEENRRCLTDAQSRISQLLIARHLPTAHSGLR